MNSIIIIIISCVIVVTLQQQQCPIGQLSFDGKKCIYTPSLSSPDKSYYDALSDCKQRAANVGISNDRASLVSVSTAFENANVLSIASEQALCVEYYIGLNNIGNTLQWSDESIYSYSNWNSGCPTVNINGSERCVTINSNGKWCNTDCQLRTCYICEIKMSMTDCYDWLHINGSTSNGIYRIDPGYGLAPFNVYCDMTTDGGGWTVIQRQVKDSSEMWKNTWQQYKNGFNNGLENGSLWLGNDRINVMSSRWNVILRVEINGEQWPDTNPNLYLYSKYNFSIADEMNSYTLYISLPIEGNASDTDPDYGFHYNNGWPFSTVDKESSADGSFCASGGFGGWWFDQCTYVAPNGKYTPSGYTGFLWWTPATGYISPIRSEMKIRRTVSMTDCYDWLHINGSTSNGIYRIDPGYGLAPFNVYCDMTTDGGGWTVIQRQVKDSSEMWKNTWQQYKNGFNNGLENGSLWLGNDRIHVMSQSNVTLRVEIYGDRTPNSLNPNIYLYGKYNFSISDELNNYTLYISLPIEGNASDADPDYGFHYNNGWPFSTVDKSSNVYGSDCANLFGGWWFNNGCTFLALNGKYNSSPRNYGFRWYNETTGNIISNRSEMKIRRQ